MIADLVILQRGENHEDGFKLPIILLNGQKYRVLPTVFFEGDVGNIEYDLFNHECTHVMYTRKISSFESNVYNASNNLIERLDTYLSLFNGFEVRELTTFFSTFEGLKFDSVIGFSHVFYQLIPLEE